MRLDSVVWEDTHASIDPRIGADGLHTWEFDARFPVDLRFFELDDRMETALNRHEYFEVVYVAHGAMRWFVQDYSFETTAGDVVIIGNHYHRTVPIARRPRSRALARFAGLFFMRQAIGPHELLEDEAELLLPFSLFGSKSCHLVRGSRPLARTVRDLMFRIGSHLPAESTRTRLAARAHLLMLLASLMGNEAARPAASTESAQRRHDLSRLHPVFAALEANLAEPPDVAAAAKLVGMSASRFMHFFKEATGRSFVRYATDFRITRARQWLATTHKPLAAITQELGFCDQSYFGLLFKRRVGMTPAQFRRASQAGA